jgi:hypothetical protein
MPQKTTQPKGMATPFHELQNTYGLKKAKQIKLRILWIHIQQLISERFPVPETKKTLARFDRQWKICEQQENKKAPH